MAPDEADRHPRIRQRTAVQTDVGVIRDHNEDAAYADPEGDFFIVADGMGGHAAGEVASQMAVEAVKGALEVARDEVGGFARTPTDEGRRGLVSVLENAVRQAHQSVFERGAKETDKQGMGTTLDVVLVAGSEAFVAHVGDSRTYLVRDGRAAQITTDHTVAEVLVIEGKLSIEEAQISPLRTILVNAIGVAPDVGVEMAHVRLRTGDRLLLCSDGLHDYFPQEQEVSEYVSQNDPDEALEKMVTIAKNRGGHDNITGIILHVLETAEVGEAADTAMQAPRRVGYEDTGSMPAVSDPLGESRPLGDDDGDGDDDAIPDEIARDDTAPVETRPVDTASRALGLSNRMPSRGDKARNERSNAATEPGDQDQASRNDPETPDTADGGEDSADRKNAGRAVAGGARGGDKRTTRRKSSSKSKQRGAVRDHADPPAAGTEDTEELPAEPSSGDEEAASAPRSRSD